jgi:putative endonuclease
LPFFHFIASLKKGDMFYIYIIYSISANKFYVGYSQNPFNRLQQHIESKGDKYTGIAFDWKLKAIFKVSSIEAAAPQ